MNESLTMVVQDATRAVHAAGDTEQAELLVAALSAEPETVEELEQAVTRFASNGRRRGFFDEWAAGTPAATRIASEPLCVIDLAARLVAWRAQDWRPQPWGRVRCYRGDEPTEQFAFYHVSDDWEFARAEGRWRAAAKERRTRRLSRPTLDARETLYGRLPKFIAARCLTAARAGKTRDQIPNIHVEWLMTPRRDLQDQTPREVLLAKREFIDLDLQDRADQWSASGTCPPGLDERTAAFRYAPFGAHEIVLYYELTRYLLDQCWRRLEQEGSYEEADEAERLARLRDRWLQTPQDEELSGEPPAAVIRRERARIPWAVAPEKAMVDDDCPLCRMMADQMGPVFVHLDGCNMDDHFAFSFHATLAEWEEEQRHWRRLNEEFERDAERRRRGAEDGEPGDGRDGEEDEQQAEAERLREPQPLVIRLFDLGADLARLHEQLKQGDDATAMVASLNRAFDNLRETLRRPADCLVEPVIERFRDELAAARNARPELAKHVDRVEERLAQIAEAAAKSG